MIRVIVVEDHPMIRESVMTLLAGAPDIKVVATCGDGSEVVATVDRTRPDVVVMDVAMPTVDGLEATRLLRAARSPARVLLLTAGLSPGLVRAAQVSGARGYLLKDGDPDELLAGVRAVAAGGTAWTARAAALLLPR